MDNSRLEGIVSGDTIAGRHTVLLSETDGDLADYLHALDILETRGKDVPLFPGHGPDLERYLAGGANTLTDAITAWTRFERSVPGWVKTWI